jgi:hypothetical protein
MLYLYGISVLYWVKPQCNIWYMDDGDNVDALQSDFRIRVRTVPSKTGAAGAGADAALPMPIPVPDMTSQCM